MIEKVSEINMDNDGSREKYSKISSKTKVTFVILLIALIISGISLPFLVSTESLNKITTTKQYVAGELSDEDVIAPFSLTFIDEVATQEAKIAARKDVLPIFTYSLSNAMFSPNF